MDRAHHVKMLNSMQMDAPVLNRPKIAKVARAYREKKIDLADAERLVALLASRNKLAKERATDVYQHFVERGLDGLGEKLRPKRERQRTHQIKILLFTGHSNRDKSHIDRDSGDYDRYRKYLGKKAYKEKYSPFWVGHLQVSGVTKAFLDKQVDVLVERRSSGTRWRDLFKACLTDPDFRNREALAPGYLEAMLVLGVQRLPAGPAADPALHAMMAADEKLTVTYRYCSNVLDMSKHTFAEAIQKNHYRKHECFLNAIYDFYKDTLLSPHRSDRYRVTRAHILELLGKTEDNITEGLRISEVVPFFRKFKLRLRVYDIFHKLVFKYDPEVPNFNNKPMYCMFHESHIYTLNHDLDSLPYKDSEEEEKEQTLVWAGSDYKVKKEEKGRKHTVVDGVEDIFQVLRALPEAETGEPNQETIYMIQRQDDLEKILWEMRERGHTPQVKFQQNGRLSLIMDRWNKQSFIVKTQQLTPTEIDGMLVTDRGKVYDKIDEVFADVRQKVIKMEHKSFYNAEDMAILDACRTTANVGWLLQEPKSTCNLVEIDVTKAFTWAFSQIKRIPIFNVFDVWRPHKTTDPIKPLNLYLLRNDAFSLVGNKERTLCYGEFLPKDLEPERILAVKEPSFLKKVNYKDIAEELFSTVISENPDDNKRFQKTIANTTYGLLEMHVNKNSKSFIFDTYNDCKFYQAKYGGLIHQIKQYEEREIQAESDPLDAGLPTDGGKRTEYVETGKELFVLSIYAQADMTNGFRYIKELLMQHFNKKMQESLRRLELAGVEVYTVKTDAFTIRKLDLWKATQALSLKEPDEPKQIGDWRLSKEEDIRFPWSGDRLTLQKNASLVPPIQEPAFAEIVLPLEEERNPDRLCQIFEEKRRVMVRAKFPGCGKSFACEHMEKRGHKVLFVCPTNKLASNYKDKGVTLNKFFGIGLSEETRHAAFDCSEYDTIVFDEIFFANIKNLARIKRFCDQHPEKIVIATGDTDQLECIDLITNQKNYDEYSNFCVNLIFPFSVKLQESKRLKKPEDRARLKQIKRDCFDERLSVADFIKKHFKLVERLTTKFNIAYKNATCQEASQKVRRMLGKSSEYEVGEVLVCRKYTKLGKSRIVFNVNYEYEITEVRESTLCLDGEVWLPLHLVRSAFVHNYARTCHSFQGSSVDEGITIFDWGNFFVTRKWIWTAITRARSLDEVVFWRYDERPENMSKLLEYLKGKVERYKAQDLKAGREFSEADYITPEWLRGCLGTSCQSCGDALTFEVVERKVVSNLSAQRLDNTLPHEKDNCVPYCAMCNCMVSNRD